MGIAAPARRRLVVLLWTGVTAAVAWGAVGLATDRVAQATRATLLGYAATYAQMLTDMGHAELPDRPSPDDPGYLAMLAAQRRWEEANPRVRDLWTLRRDVEGRVVHLVDAESDFNQNGAIDTAWEHRVPAGAIDAVPLSDAARRAFRGEPEVDLVPRSDARGVVVEGWAPLRGPDGRVEAVVGVAFDASPVESLQGAAAALAGGLVGVAGLALGLIVRQRSVSGEARQRMAEAAFLQDEAERSRQAAVVAAERVTGRVCTLVDGLPVPAALRVGDRVHPNAALVRRLGGPVATLAAFFRAGWGPAAGAARAFYDADRVAGFPEPRVIPLGGDGHRWVTAVDGDHDLWLFVPVEAPRPVIAPAPPLGALDVVADLLDVGVAVFDDEGALRAANTRYRELWGEVAELVQPGVRHDSLVEAGIDAGLHWASGLGEDAWREARAQGLLDAAGTHVELTRDGPVRLVWSRTPAGDRVCVVLPGAAEAAGPSAPHDLPELPGPRRRRGGARR